MDIFVLKLFIILEIFNIYDGNFIVIIRIFFIPLCKECYNSTFSNLLFYLNIAKLSYFILLITPYFLC